MKKVSLKTMKALLEEFKGYVEDYDDEQSKSHAEQDVASIINVIAMLSVRGLIKNDL